MRLHKKHRGVFVLPAAVAAALAIGAGYVGFEQQRGAQSAISTPSERKINGVVIRGNTLLAGSVTISMCTERGRRSS